MPAVRSSSHQFYRGIWEYIWVSRSPNEVYTYEVIEWG